MGCHTLAFRPCKHQPSENACTSAERLLRATLRKRQDFGLIVVFCPIQYWFPHICNQYVKDPNVHRMNTKEGRRQSPQRRLAHNPALFTPQPCHSSEKVKWPKGSLRFGHMARMVLPGGNTEQRGCACNSRHIRQASYQEISIYISRIYWLIFNIICQYHSNACKDYHSHNH